MATRHDAELRALRCRHQRQQNMQVALRGAADALRWKKMSAIMLSRMRHEFEFPFLFEFPTVLLQLRCA